jgi:hypothetical protein
MAVITIAASSVGPPRPDEARFSLTFAPRNLHGRSNTESARFQFTVRSAVAIYCAKYDSSLM